MGRELGKKKFHLWDVTIDLTLMFSYIKNYEFMFFFFEVRI